MNKTRFFMATLGLIVALGANAQVYNWADGEEPYSADSIRGLFVGLNLGFYKANNSTASNYGGYGFDRAGVRLDFANSWLNQAIQGTFPAIDRTNAALGGATQSEWIFNESDMPGAMRFSPSFMVGGHLRYMFNADFGVFAEINGTKPVTVGEFTIQRVGVSPNPGQQNLERFQIRGEEQRLIINVGAHQVIGRKAAEQRGGSGTVLPFIDFGVNTTFVKFEENLIFLGDLVGTVDLTQFYNRQGQFTNEARILTGVGLGGFGGLGAQIQLGSKFTIDASYVASLEQIKLGELNQRSFQHIFVLKVVYLTF